MAAKQTDPKLTIILLIVAAVLFAIAALITAGTTQLLSGIAAILFAVAAIVQRLRTTRTSRD